MIETKITQRDQVVKQEAHLEAELHQAAALSRECFQLQVSLQAERDGIVPDVKNLRRACVRLAELTAQIICAGQLLAMARARHAECQAALTHYRTWLRSPSGQRARGVLDGDGDGGDAT